MNLRGINYDTGISTTHHTFSREIFDHARVQREVEIIKNDLHCNAIWISGQRLERPLLAAEIALEPGYSFFGSDFFR